MKIKTVWDSHHIGLWETHLQEALQAERRRLDEYAANDKQYVSLSNASQRARKVLEALHLGIPVEEVSDGLLLSGTIIVAVTKSKFRVKGQANWTVYRGGLATLSSRFHLGIPNT